MLSLDKISTRNETLAAVSLDIITSLPEDMIKETAKHLSDADRINLLSVSRGVHAFFQEKHVLDQFLQRVAYGMQDKVEQLFTDVYRGDVAKIQEALRYQGQFTDYSGRSFHCTAYEYAYWAKDTHMCHMLERYMDEETKAHLLIRIDVNDATGLCYQQNGEECRSAHFDFTPLKAAYRRYLTGYNAWVDALNWDAMDAAWLDIGKAQRNVPAHVAQEYCRPDRAFYPRPKFNEATLPRVLTCYDRITLRDYSWFPKATSHFDLVSNFAFFRGAGTVRVRWDGGGCERPSLTDLAAITRLDEVRTAQLTQSRDYLQSSLASHRFSR